MALLASPTARPFVAAQVPPRSSVLNVTCSAASSLRAGRLTPRRETPGATRKSLVARSGPVTLSDPSKVDKSPGSARDTVVVVDNYDSFTYNLCQYLGDLGCKYIVLPNDAVTAEELAIMQPLGVLVSPGPGRPEDSGISLATVEQLGGAGVPVFGVCMGHQCLGQVFGGRVVRAPHGVMHGKVTMVHHDGRGLFRGLPNPFRAARYHSLVVDRERLPDCLEVTAWTEDGTIMGLRHRTLRAIQGVQFHPESVITQNGLVIVQNFLDSLPMPATSAQS